MPDERQVDKAFELDLDSLIPESKKIKLNNKILEVLPPTVNEFITITRMQMRIKNSSDEAEAMEVFAELPKILKRCIPELGDIELNFSQLMILIGFVLNMATPTDNKALEQMGITPDTTQKKIAEPELPESSAIS
jgi:hypothetical protein